MPNINTFTYLKGLNNFKSCFNKVLLNIQFYYTSNLLWLKNDLKATIV